MLQKLEGLKTTLWTGLLVSITFAVSAYFQPVWLVKLALIEQVLIGLFVVGVLLTIQFSRSRYTLIILFILLYYSAVQGYVPHASPYLYEHDLLFATSLFLLVFLTQVKDRSLFSAHGLYRLLGIASCVVLAKLWLLLTSAVKPHLVALTMGELIAEKIALDIPLFVVAFYLLYKSLRAPNLFVASLLTSLILISLVYQQQLVMPLAMFISLLLVHYVVVVIVDSYYLAYRDELTGLPSRRALNQYALSLGRKYCVAMLDVDHFKKFNDNYGHDIGDQVLKLVAAKLSQVKAGGRVFRYGGEEFTAIFPRKVAEDAFNELDKLRQSIQDYKIVIRHPLRKNKKARQNNKKDDVKSVSVTISIGVASRESKQSFEQVVKEADLALYRAKKKGRNNVSY